MLPASARQDARGRGQRPVRGLEVGQRLVASVTWVDIQHEEPGTITAITADNITVVTAITADNITVVTAGNITTAGTGVTPMTVGAWINVQHGEAGARGDADVRAGPPLPPAPNHGLN
ncbi:MAG: hypothetical protein O2888_04125 [Chloroflexi bacterium]|nr:hypothetical protein [Chloroflexota bacterium]